MSRRLLGVVIAALMVLTTVGSAGGATDATGLITIAGRLEYVANLSVAHYEVADYVLLYNDTSLLAKLTGKDVLVTGTESTAPSIIMKKSLAVKQITAKSGDSGSVTIPVMPVPGPAHPPSGDTKVTIPAIPPAPVIPPGDNTRVTIPAFPPAPVIPPGDNTGVTIPAIPPADSGRVIIMPVRPVAFHGTAYHILFGRLIAGGDSRFYLVSPEESTEKAWVTSTTVNLAALVGKKVALVVAKNLLPDGQVQYQVRSAVDISGDMGAHIAAGNGLIYAVPPTAIKVRLRGKDVAMDPAPILGNGRTLVGLRAIAEGLGARVTWEQAVETAVVALSDREVRVTIGSNQVTVQQQGHEAVRLEADVTPVIVNGRTMVPARILTECLGLTVEWNETAHAVELH